MEEKKEIKRRGPRNSAKTKLKAVRVAKGMSQQEVATLADFDLRLLQHYEQGVRSFAGAHFSVILRICTALDCDLSEVLENEKDIEAWENYKKR